jgi:DNA-binding transcriptional ArsR family regulator
MSTASEHRKASENRIKAMSHPLRAAILRILTERPASPAEMAHELDAELSNVSYHAKQLVAFECAELVDIQVVRGALEHFYRATERPLVDIEEWLTLDDQGLQEVLDAHERTRREILEIEARSAARLVESDATGVGVSSSQACFQMPDPQRR